MFVSEMIKKRALEEAEEMIKRGALESNISLGNTILVITPIRDSLKMENVFYDFNLDGRQFYVGLKT